jgi:hypothetical protein
LAIVASVLMLNSHAFDAGRWQAGEKLVGLGVSAATIDAGYEWVGFHAETPANAAQPVPARTWYEGWWAGFTPCGLVSSLPLTDAGAELVGTSEYALNLVAGPPQTLYLYRLAGPGCNTG